MPHTRSAAPTEKSQQEEEKSLAPAERPSKTFILPSSISPNARLLSLPNPQSGELSRYFFCPKRGIFEFTVIASPPTAARSILFTPNVCKTTIASNEEKKRPAGTASIAKKAELLVATPFDAIFLLAPLFASSSKAGRTLFQPIDDIIDSNDDLPAHLRHVLYNETFRSCLLSRAEAISDTVEAGDEKMFRFSEMKLLKELIAKAERLAELGLPASLEERFVRQALAAPLMSVKRQDTSISQASNGDETSSKSDKSDEKQDSPSTMATSTPSVSTPVGETTPAPGEDSASSDQVSRLQRIATALSFMKESYLSPTLSSHLDEILVSPESPLDLKPLTDRLKQLADLRAEAFASRSMSDFSRKRGLGDEEAEARAEKKRKKDEEEKIKKVAESRGVRDLKKVNTSGMKKMSDFFGKAAAKKKA